MNDKSAPVVYLTRRERFSAAHRLWSEHLTDEQNHALYGPCAREYGHGHNYVMEVTLRDPVNEKTGVIVNLTELRDAMRELVIDKVDHRHLNHDSELTRGINPTAENLVVLFWNVLQGRFGELLYEVRLRETDKNWVTYRGE
jgi:6-pyruvoyltetrahydropterin/6-carboxytetrahydropterin synthase